MARAKLKPKGKRQYRTLPGQKYAHCKVETPEKFDKAVEEYVEYKTKKKEPLTISGALLWMGIYDQHTLARYAERDGFAPSVKRLQVVVREGYERRMHTTQPTGAIFALKNMGWSDRVEAAVTNPDGTPLTIKVEVVFVTPGGKRKN